MPVGMFAASCESLTSLKVANTTISMAKEVGAGQFKPAARGRGADPDAPFRSLPAFCRAAATLKPTSDSDIKIEVWLPLTSWNGKLQSVGNGAWGGVISYPAMAEALASGYATASTDTGHAGNTADFIPGHPEKLADWLHRSVHEMTVSAKAIIDGYYGSAPKYAYWNGCSTGGRQAFTEAQRYPNDYDGIIAGAPAAYVSRLQGMQAWIGQQVHRNAGASIPEDKFSLLHNAVMAACDAIDGVKDGVLEDPTKCKFDPGVLACKSGEGANCLTADQVETARKLYAGPQANGKTIYPGIEPGTEKGWNMLGGARPMSLAVEMYQLVANDGHWDVSAMKVSDIERFEKEKGAAVDSVDPNLKPFFGHKGKLLVYHGWADPGVPPMGTVNYYNHVSKTVGEAQTRDSMRLFMVPGMGHCRGGDGTDTFDMVKALEAWVEHGKAPERIEAARIRDGKTDRTRPLCAYPQTAVYKGSGSTDDASNFVCRVP